MILSGWILPDLYEIQCASCYSKKGHIQIVMRYLESLKLKEPVTYKRVAELLNNKISPDDFAVIRLGWLKLVDLPEPFLFVAENSPIVFLTSRYEKLGYNIMVLSNPLSLTPVTCSSKEIFNP